MAMTIQETFDYLDSLIDQAHARRTQIDGEIATLAEKYKGGGNVHPDDAHQVLRLKAERDRIDDGIKAVVNSPHYFGYLDHYNEKYMTPKQQPVQAEPEGPGILDRVWQGTKDTAKFAIQHPQRAAAHLKLGVQELGTLPFRAIEGLLDKNIFHTRPGLESRQREVAEADIAAGVEPRGTGSVVAEALGQALVPIPLVVKPAEKLLSLRSAGNVAKGAGLGAGLYGTERVAHDEPVDDAGLGAAAGLTGLLSGAVGRMAGRVGPSAAPRAEETASVSDTHTPPNAGGTRDNIDASHVRVYTDPPVPDASGRMLPAPTKLLEHKPSMTTPVPPRGLPAPEGPNPSPFREIVQSIRAKTQAGEALDETEKRFLLWYRQNKGTPPPNAAGAKDVTGVVPERQMKRQPDGSWRPLEEVLAPTPKPAPEAVKEAKPNVVSGAPKAEAEIIPKTPVEAPKPQTLEEILTAEKPAPTAPLAEAARGIEAEKAARLSAGKTPANQPIARSAAEIQRQERIPGGAAMRKAQAEKAAQTAAPAKDVMDEIKKFDAEVSKAAQEALLGKVVKGEVNVKDVPIKRRAKAPKSEAPAPAVKGEVGVEPLSSGKIAKTSKVEQLYAKLQAEGKTPQQAKEIAEFKADAKLPPAAEKPPAEIQLEKFIADKGYRVNVKEPFPGQKSYDVIDPKTGNILARGDRDSILNAMQVRNEGKGIKLRSGVGPEDFSEFSKFVKSKLRWGAPEGVEVENNPHRDKLVNAIMREAGLETPDFAVRKSKSGTQITDAGRHYEDAWKTRVNDLLYKEKDGVYKTTKLFDYFSADQKDQKLVNDVLVLGDKIGAEFSAADLAKHGLNTAQIRMYEGVREAIKIVAEWIKEIPGHGGFVARHEGYIPRSFFGDVEIFINGKKYVPTKMTTLGEQELGSTFNTLHEATKKVWELKDKYPGAKFSIKFHQDPNYMPSRSLADYKAVAAAKKKIEDLGTLSADEIAAAFKVERSMKGFLRHLEERIGERGYETEDIQKVLGTYFVQGARTVERQHLKTTVGEILGKEGVDLTPGQIRFLNEYVERVAGKPAWDELIVKHLIRDTVVGKWLDPVKGGAAIQTAKDWITYKSLGFGNVSWALVNLDSLTRHVWPMLQAEASKSMGGMATEKYLGGALKEFFKNPALRQKLAHHGVIDIQMMSESRPDILKPHLFGKGKWTPSKVIMALGTWTEEFTRGVAAIARYRMALDQGLNDAQAMQAASKFVAETVGRYTRGGKPPAFTGGIGSILGMFKTYPVVMLQNMVKAFESKDAGVITRYMLAALGASGIIGALPGSEEVDKLSARYIGFSPIQWGYEHIPHSILTGIGSIAPEGYDVDLSRKAGLPDVFPTDTQDWLGPVVNTYAMTIADILNGEYGNAALDMLPTSVRNIYAANAKPGYVMGRSGKPSAELPDTRGQRIKRGFGFQGNKEVWESRAYAANQGIQQHQLDAKKRLAAKILDGKASDAEREEFARMGGTSRMLREEHIRRNSTALQRQERRAPRNLHELFQYQE